SERAEELFPFRRGKPVIRVLDVVVTDHSRHGGSLVSWADAAPERLAKWLQLDGPPPGPTCPQSPSRGVTGGSSRISRCGSGDYPALPQPRQRAEAEILESLMSCESSPRRPFLTSGSSRHSLT